MTSKSKMNLMSMIAVQMTKTMMKRINNHNIIMIQISIRNMIIMKIFKNVKTMKVKARKSSRMKKTLS
jgi:hypothetical protein